MIVNLTNAEIATLDAAIALYRTWTKNADERKTLQAASAKLKAAHAADHARRQRNAARTQATSPPKAKDPTHGHQQKP